MNERFFYECSSWADTAASNFVREGNPNLRKQPFNLCRHQVGGSAEFVMVSIVPCRMLLNSQSGLHQNRSGAGLPWKRIIAASTYSWHYPIIFGTCVWRTFQEQ